VLVAAKIRQGGVQPGGEPGVAAQAGPLLVEPDERFGDEVLGVGGVVGGTPGEGEQAGLPPLHEVVQRGVLPALQRVEQVEVPVTFRSHVDV